MESFGSGELSEFEPDQDEVGLPAATGVVKTSNVCPVNPTGEDFGMVGVRFLERVDCYFLADPYIVSSWVKGKLGMDTYMKVSRSVFFYFLCILHPEETCGVLCSPE